MHYFYDIGIEKNTEAGTPYSETLHLSYGVITKVQIVIPDGHKGLAHLQLFYHEAQLYPLSRGENYHGDGIRIEFEDNFPLYVSPYNLKAKGWNTDDTNDHSFLVGINILRPEMQLIPPSLETIKAMEDLIGYEGEL